MRDKYFRVYVKGRKEERNQGRKAEDKSCGLTRTDIDFWIYVGYEDFSAYVKGRKERRKEGGDNPCELPITDTDFRVYVSTDLLNHP